MDIPEMWERWDMACRFRYGDNDEKRKIARAICSKESISFALCFASILGAVNTEDGFKFAQIYEEIKLSETGL